MTDLIDILQNLKQKKEELIFLSEVYDELFKPWISIEYKEPEQIISSYSRTQNLDLLYKLQNVLKNASTVTEKSRTAVVERPPVCQKEKVTKKPVVKIAAKQIDQPKIRREISSNDKSKKLPHFVPAHQTAPFKTDPNLHRSKMRSRSAVSRNIPSRATSASSDKKKSSVKSESKPEVVETLKSVDVTKDDNIDENVQEAIYQLQKDILLLQEQPVEETKPSVPKILKKTIFEAGDQVKIPIQLKKECRSYYKFTSKLVGIYLQKMKLGINSNPQKCMKLSSNNLTNSVGDVRHIVWVTHRARTLQQLLQKILEMIKMLDLDSCNATQIGFLQNCLSWIITQYLDLKQDNLNRQREDYSPCKSQESQEIQQWLDEQRKIRTRAHDLYNCVLETSYLTNCPFIKSSDSRKNQSLSLYVPQASLLPFKFCLGKSACLIECIPSMEKHTRPLIIHQQLQLYWVSLIDKWVQMFQEKFENGDSLSALYRQIYGLLLGKYPVLLRDVS